MSNEDKMLEKLRERAFELRKAAYEFGLSDRAEDHDRMMEAQRSLFDEMEACAAIKDAEIARATKQSADRLIGLCKQLMS